VRAVASVARPPGRAPGDRPGHGAAGVESRSGIKGGHRLAV